jgi:hypothetical protein
MSEWESGNKKVKQYWLWMEEEYHRLLDVEEDSLHNVQLSLQFHIHHFQEHFDPFIIKYKTNPMSNYIKHNIKEKKFCYSKHIQ